MCENWVTTRVCEGFCDKKESIKSLNERQDQEETVNLNEEVNDLYLFLQLRMKESIQGFSTLIVSFSL